MRSDSQYFDARGSYNDGSRSAEDETEAPLALKVGGFPVRLSLCGDELAEAIVRDMRAAAGAPRRGRRCHHAAPRSAYT
jgi:hypothetical protein